MLRIFVTVVAAAIIVVAIVAARTKLIFTACNIHLVLRIGLFLKKM